jgi:hypothetical protein
MGGDKYFTVLLHQKNATQTNSDQSFRHPCRTRTILLIMSQCMQERMKSTTHLVLQSPPTPFPPLIQKGGGPSGLGSPAGFVVDIAEPCAPPVIFPVAPVVIFAPAGLFIPPGVLFNVTIFEKVFPPSLLVRSTGFEIPVLFESHITATVLPDTLILTLSFIIFDLFLVRSLALYLHMFYLRHCSLRIIYGCSTPIPYKYVPDAATSTSRIPAWYGLRVCHCLLNVLWGNTLMWRPDLTHG